jgi:hypothetical protein
VAQENNFPPSLCPRKEKNARNSQSFRKGCSTNPAAMNKGLELFKITTLNNMAASNNSNVHRQQCPSLAIFVVSLVKLSGDKSFG